MDISVVPSLKRQKVLVINAETGESQQCPEFTLGDEDQSVWNFGRLLDLRKRLQ